MFLRLTLLAVCVFLLSAAAGRLVSTRAIAVQDVLAGYDPPDRGTATAKVTLDGVALVAPLAALALVAATRPGNGLASRRRPRDRG